MQCIIMEKTLINSNLHYDETKKRAHDSQIVRAKKTQVEAEQFNSQQIRYSC